MEGANIRQPDFYERHQGEAVNLFMKEGTLSGDISGYDRDLGIVRLRDSIQRVYNPDGTSQFVEFSGDFEFDAGIVHLRAESTREDRLGRIVKYNQDLEKEDAANGTALESPRDKDSTEQDN